MSWRDRPENLAGVLSAEGLDVHHALRALPVHSHVQDPSDKKQKYKIITDGLHLVHCCIPILRNRFAYLPSNALTSTAFYEDIFAGLKVIDMLSIGELIMFFCATKQNCAELVDRHS